MESKCPEMRINISKDSMPASYVFWRTRNYVSVYVRVFVCVWCDTPFKNTTFVNW